MSLALAWHVNSQKRLCLALIVACFLILIPTLFVVASGLGIGDSEKLIQRDGVSGSQLLISGGSNSWFYIGPGGVHFNPDAPPFRIVALVPLVMAAMALLALLGMLAKGVDFYTVVIAAVFIYLLISLLAGIQLNITDLLR